MKKIEAEFQQKAREEIGNRESSSHFNSSNVKNETQSNKTEHNNLQ